MESLGQMLHRLSILWDPLVARSGYLRRRLTETSDVALSLPSQITAEAFAVVVCFCYGSEISITPFNVVILRVAAELLEMTDDKGTENANLCGKTEAYFCQAVAVSREYASVMLRSCVELLPEAEEKAFLASRCVEALVSADSVSASGGVNDKWVDELIELTAEEFLMIADSMKGRLGGNHDILYRTVDLYIKERTDDLTEEQKIRICSVVDCNRLSQHLLMHAVQNPIMPLRFVIRAMLVEQLNTRRSFNSAAACATHTHAHKQQPDDCITLGAIMHRDAALRRIAHLKASMEVTSARIVNLENDLKEMKQQLRESEMKRAMLESTRSASFRFSWEKNKRGKREKGMPASSAAADSRGAGTPRNSKRLSKLMTGFRNMFQTSKPESEKGLSLSESDDEWPPPHLKKHSFA